MNQNIVFKIYGLLCTVSHESILFIFYFPLQPTLLVRLIG